MGFVNSFSEIVLAQDSKKVGLLLNASKKKIINNERSHDCCRRTKHRVYLRIHLFGSKYFVHELDRNRNKQKDSNSMEEVLEPETGNEEQIHKNNI